MATDPKKAEKEEFGAPRGEDNYGVGQLDDGSIAVLTPEEYLAYVAKRNAEEEDEEDDDVSDLAALEELFPNG
jgi:hypothetical protein